MKISVRERKILIAGAVVLVVSGAVYFGDRLLPGRSAQAADLEARKRTLAQQRELIALEGNYRARLEADRQRLAADHARLFPGDNPTIAGAELQKLLGDLAAQSGVDVQRKEIQRETKLQDNLVKISVRIETSCGLDQLIQLLAAVENYEKFLTVDTLNITAFRIQKRFDIRPSLTIAAFILVPEAKPPEKVANN